jgi:NAD(P)-dependent dehydrogenase (short-subunit alcohol dehydrogenase family)
LNVLVNRYSELDDYFWRRLLWKGHCWNHNKYSSPLHLTSLFIKLKSLNTIINVTSGLAFVQLSKVPVYCATKAFSIHLHFQWDTC